MGWGSVRGSYLCSDGRGGCVPRDLPGRVVRVPVRPGGPLGLLLTRSTRPLTPPSVSSRHSSRRLRVKYVVRGPESKAEAEGEDGSRDSVSVVLVSCPDRVRPGRGGYASTMTVTTTGATTRHSPGSRPFLDPASIPTPTSNSETEGCPRVRYLPSKTYAHVLSHYHGLPDT